MGWQGVGLTLDTGAPDEGFPEKERDGRGGGPEGSVVGSGGGPSSSLTLRVGGRDVVAEGAVFEVDARRISEGMMRKFGQGGSDGGADAPAAGGPGSNTTEALACPFPFPFPFVPSLAGPFAFRVFFPFI